MKDFLLFAHLQIKRIRKNRIFFLPISLILVFFLFLFTNLSLKKELNQQELKMAFSNFSPAPYVRLGVLGSLDIDISAEAAVVMEDSSKVVVFGKNEGLRFSTASTAKIMTALSALDYYHPDDVLTIYAENVEGAVVGFKKGEQFTFEDLLYAMLLPSGNDAALAIAQNYRGGEEEFIKKMNEKALFLRLFNTHFSDSAGLLDDQDYTTALDLARLSSIAMKNEVFAKAVGTKQRVIFDLEKSNLYVLNNLNKLLDINGVNGVKTGFTSEALGVLVTSKIKNGKKFIIVVMRSEDRFLDTQKLISLVDGKIRYLDIAP